MASEERKAENPPEIDLKEVEMLLEALERDLKKVQGGARDVQVAQVRYADENDQQAGREGAETQLPSIGLQI